MNAGRECPSCGSLIAPGMRFCARCGADVSAGQSSVATLPMASEAAAVSSSDILDVLRDATLGEYDVLGELGRGGMASVYLAHDIALDRKVAIKVMLPDVVAQEGMAERFKREARTAASLGHPHIIPIFAVRQAQDTLFFIMKYVEGRPLDSVIKEIGKLPFDMVRTILGQVGGALDYAHRKGVVHRDIKPGNIMVDTEGWAVVTDFGIAKVTEAHGLTLSGAIVGTPYYMSPEQAEAGVITGASDQYSLGVVAYEMLSGRLPFTSGSLMALLVAHRESPPPPIETLRPDCPPGLRSAVMRMLEKRPERRFPSMREAVVAFGAASADSADAVRTAMITLAKSNPRPVRRVQTPSSPIPASRSGRPGAPVSGAVARPRRRRWLVGAGVAVGLAAASGGVWLGVNRLSPQAPAADSTQFVQAPPVRPVGGADTTAAPAPETGVTRVSSPQARDTRRAPATSSAALAAQGRPRDTATARPRMQTPVPAPSTQGRGYITLGKHPIDRPSVLFVNGVERAMLGPLRPYEVPAGLVRLSLRAEGCTSWDTTVTVLPDSTEVIGYKKPTCP